MYTGAENLGGNLRIVPTTRREYFPTIFYEFSITLILIPKPDKESPASYFMDINELIVKCKMERQKSSQHNIDREQGRRTDTTQLQDLV